MQIYLVGGAVRDLLLNISITDYDYVVVGSSVEEMLNLGYFPVGKDFPVFLHPITKREYALARTERKIAKGYHGFSFYTDKNVSLEQDLQRRDLTINAMALPIDENHQPLSLDYLIDYFNAQDDLNHGILRHVSIAFSEDPVRILRIARFAARYNFKVYEDTYLLMRKIVNNKELQVLASERIWQELVKGFSENYPHNVLQILNNCQALEYILLPLSKNLLAHISFLHKISQLKLSNLDNKMQFINIFAIENLILPINQLNIEYILPSLLLSTSLEEINNLNKFLKPPKLIQELSILSYKLYQHLQSLNNKALISAQDILSILNITDALRRSDRFYKALKVIYLYENNYNLAKKLNDDIFILLDKALFECKNLDIKPILLNKASNIDIQQAIMKEKLNIIEKIIYNCI